MGFDDDSPVSFSVLEVCCVNMLFAVIPVVVSSLILVLSGVRVVMLVSVV